MAAEDGVEEDGVVVVAKRKIQRQSLPPEEVEEQEVEALALASGPATALVGLIL